MGNYENLKQSITEVIRTNGNQEITGSILQNVLLTIVSSVGANATFAGIATPTTNPGTPDGPVFYLASESGTYTNFNAIELQAGLSVLMWNGSWSSQQIFAIDNEPTAGSDNLVKSGGVQEELALGAVYDVSAKNPTAGSNNDGKWESLSALLSDANLNTLIPTAVRKGGMSIKFVQSSDNKYVQWRLTHQNWTTDIKHWQKEVNNNSFYELNNEANNLTKMYSKAVKSLYLPFTPNNGYKLCVVARNQTSTIEQPKYQFKLYEDNLDGGVTNKGFMFTSNDYVEPISKFAIIPLTSFGYTDVMTGYLVLDWSEITDGTFNYSMTTIEYRVNPTFILNSVSQAIDDINTTVNNYISTTKENLLPTAEEHYANLENASIGSVYSIEDVEFPSYSYWIIDCREGDTFVLSTVSNTQKAKAYAILDSSNIVLDIHQDAISNEKVTIPYGGKTLIVNSRTQSGDIYSVVSNIGRLSTKEEVHHLQENIEANTEAISLKMRGVTSSFIANGQKNELSSPIPSGTKIVSVTGGDWPSINLYDENGENRLNFTKSFLPYITNRVYYKASTSISGNPLLSIHTEGIEQQVELNKKNIGLLEQNIGIDIDFESGSINYLTGEETVNAKSIRSPFIQIGKDVKVSFNSPRNITDCYIIKYLDKSYVGYETYIDLSQDLNYNSFNDLIIVKDNSFDSFRIRVSVPNASADWSTSDINSSKAVIYTDGSIMDLVDKIADTPEPCIWKGIYASLNGLQIGEEWTPAFVNLQNYGCYIIRCSVGDTFKISTRSNTVAAKSYAFLDKDFKCLDIHQESIAAKITAPQCSSYLIVNTRTLDEDKYYLIKEYGNLVSQKENWKKPYFSDIYSLCINNISYLNGSILPSSGVDLTTGGPIPVLGDIVARVQSGRKTDDVILYIIKYLNGVYVGYSEYIGENALSPINLIKDNTFNQIIPKFHLNSNTSWTEEEVANSYFYFCSPQNQLPLKDISGEAIDYKKYKIANYDNEFSFDFLSSTQMKTDILALRPNFNIPNKGTFLSTDIDYTGVRSEPVSDLQLTRANVPYLYINGEKRGTIVLFDETDGTPFIYDKNGNKRTIVLS